MFLVVYYHYYTYNFRRQSKSIFKGNFCVRQRTSVSVNEAFSEAGLCLPPLIKLKKNETLDGPAKPIWVR